MLRGTGVSTGIGMAQAMIWQTNLTYDYIPRKSTVPDEEVKRFEAARSIMQDKTGDMRLRTERMLGSGEAAIFDAYSMILDDEEVLLDPLRERIIKENYSAEFAVATQFDSIARQFMRIDNEYLRQRVDDIIALRDQLMRELMGQHPADVSHLDRPTVIVAHNLSAADIANLDLSRLEGIVCEVGGYSSHMSIIARTLGVPTVVGASGVLAEIKQGALVALDGETGEVWIEPGSDDIYMLRRRGDLLAERRAKTQKYYGRPTISTDGRRVELSASIGTPAEVDKAMAADAESMSVYRVDFMNTSLEEQPDEEEQFKIYREMLQKAKGKAVTVRTFDDGGKLAFSGGKNRDCENPVIGYRGIRMSLGRPSIFRTQLRALLRASAYGTLRVLFPMVSTLDEVDGATNALKSVKDELRREGIPFDEKMPVGVNIEVPSAALICEDIAPKVDFLNIDINNLAQFTLAVDRENPELYHLYRQHHPAVLRLVAHTVEVAHENEKPCFISGESPGQESMMPLMLGMGADGFSVNPGQILRAREILNSCSYTDCKKTAGEILRLARADEIVKKMEELKPEL